MGLFEKIKLALLLKKAEKEIRMNGVKSFLTSKTLAGILAVAIPLIAKVTGIGDEALSGAVGDGIQVFGIILATIGRFTAKKDLAVVGDGK